MIGLKLDDTIVAISTPIGEGGIGIVRLSGKDALSIVDKIFESKDGNKPSSFKTYTVHYGYIVKRWERKTKKNSRFDKSEVIDEVILTVMRAPRSYTKEDVVEINCHSGIVPLEKILDLVLSNGAKLAQPGEFTKRAFLNGRIDILQAEAVLDIIKAKTDLSLKAAIGNLEGKFSKKIQDIRDSLMDVFMYIESSIDFSEEDDVERLKRKDIFIKLKSIKKEVEKLISGAREGIIMRQGIKTVICGSPNVGKSSLMNAILKDSRAIVTHLPGTTRDTIEELANVKNIPLVLIDTAGIKDTRCIIEREGIKRSHFSIQNADLILLVLDNSRRLNKSDFKLINNIKDREVIIVINKQDLKRRIDVKTLRKVFPEDKIVCISVKKCLGIDKLEDAIQKVVFKGRIPAPEYGNVANNRQLNLLRDSVKDIKNAVSSYENKIPVDCISVYVRSSIESLGEITGQTITEETLDKIFSKFCIGK